MAPAINLVQEKIVVLLKPWNKVPSFVCWDNNNSNVGMVKCVAANTAQEASTQYVETSAAHHNHISIMLFCCLANQLSSSSRHHKSLMAYLYIEIYYASGRDADCNSGKPFLTGKPPHSGLQSCVLSRLPPAAAPATLHMGC